jgi:HprK-related kinase A
MSPEEAARGLTGDGLLLDLGAMRVRVRSPLPDLPGPLARVYRHLPPCEDDGFVDCEVDLLPARSLRRPWRPGVRFLADGTEPFAPLPHGLSLPQLEWGLNWVFAHLATRHLLLHAGALEHAGRGLLLVAGPGSGKSTLTAALALAGLRLLSDEFGVVRRADGLLLPMPRPVSLKNASIALIAARGAAAALGPTFHRTHKGDVAHLAPPAEALARRHEPVRPALIVFPTWQEGASLDLVPVRPARALSELAANSFNFGVLGPAGYAAAADLVAGCPCWRLTFGSLDEAIERLRALCASDGLA